MKILLLAPHPFFQPRGTPIAEKLLVEVLLAHGHQVEVLTFHEGEDPGVPGCPVHRIPRLPWIRGIRPGFSVKKLVSDAVMLVSFLRRARGRNGRRYDLVHAVEESAFMALLARRWLGVPYVYDMDSDLAQQMIDKFPLLASIRPTLEWFERRAVRGSAGVLAVCRSLEEKAREYAPGGLVGRVEDVTLLPAAATRPEVEERLADLAGGGSGPLVLYVGNLETYQGIDLLLAGFTLARERVPAARLVVIGGSAENVHHYREVAARAGIGESVTFTGPRPIERLGGYLGQATVLVSPRIQGTNTPMKVYSYLDSGRPLLATRLPTHTQILDDQVACLVEPEPRDFARGLVLLLESEPLRERLAGNARRLVLDEFTPAAFADKLLRFYDAVTQKIGNGPAHAELPHPVHHHGS